MCRLINNPEPFSGQPVTVCKMESIFFRLDRKRLYAVQVGVVISTVHVVPVVEITHAGKINSQTYTIEILGEREGSKRVQLKLVSSAVAILRIRRTIGSFDWNSG